MSRWADKYIEELRAGKSVSFRPSGRSMEPLIRSGQLCHLRPEDPFHIGDIVLCEVNGSQYLHLIGANTTAGQVWYRIENAAGHINGWITRDKIYGWLYSVED